MTFKAVVVNGPGDGCEVEEFERIEDLPLQKTAEGDVVVRVSYSTLNYKDGMVLEGKPGVTKGYPIVAGIDLAGTIVSAGSGFEAGQPVVLTGHYLGQHMDGGFSQLARVPSSWLVALPEAMSERRSMAIGTAVI